jgi:hypothetical protein
MTWPCPSQSPGMKERRAPLGSWQSVIDIHGPWSHTDLDTEPGLLLFSYVTFGSSVTFSLGASVSLYAKWVQ